MLKNQRIKMSDLSIGGFEPLTTIDYPDNLSCVIFTQGCSWNCTYCHNQDLIPIAKISKMNYYDILKFIKSRQGLLDSVVFSGGEPLLQNGLIDAIKQVKKLGFKIGLHTAGIYPKRFAKILKFVDWVGFDIKHLQEKYARITQVDGSGDKAYQSLEILQKSGVDYQLRLTQNSLITNKDIEVLKDRLQENITIQKEEQWN